MPSYIRNILGILLILTLAACGDSSTSPTTPQPDMAGVDMSDRCANACAERACGTAPDCDVDCGTCSDDESCDGGQCVCVPQCDGKVCGPDGCGGTCGECATGEECNTVMGTCADTCMPASCEMQGIECGMAMDGCGNEISCPACAQDDMCIEGACTSTGPPNFEWVSPSGRDELGDEFMLEWTDGDPDDDATISLYYTDSQAASVMRTAIVEGLSEDDAADSYAWDTTGLERGLYWLVAVIDDGTDTVTVEAPEPVVKPIPSCVASGGNTIDVDLPATVEVSLRPLLNGQPLDASDITADDHVEIEVRDSITGFPVASFSTWDSTTASPLPGSVTLDLIPSYYDFYVIPCCDFAIAPTPGGIWPDMEARVAQDVEIRADSSLDVDIETVDIDLTLTLDGQPISNSNTSPGDYGRIHIEGLTILPWDFEAATPANFPVRRTVVPGVYFAEYDGRSAGPLWPRVFPDDGRPSLGEVDFTQTGTVTVDVPVAEPSIDVEIDGQPLTQTQIDNNAVSLDMIQASRFGLESHYRAGSASQYPFTPKLVSDEYTVVLRSRSPDFGEWNLPVEENVRIDDTDRTLSLDTVEVTFDITLDGVGESSLTSTATDKARISVLKRVGEQSIVVMSIDTTEVGRTFKLPSGEYLIAVSNEPFAADNQVWPVGNITLGSFDTAQSMWNIDLESVDATLGFLRNGIAPANEAEAGGATLTLLSGETRLLDLHRAWDPFLAQLNDTTSKKIFKRTYDVVFDSPSNRYPSSEPWPYGRYVVEGHDFAATPTLLIDPLAVASAYTWDFTYAAMSWDQILDPTERIQRTNGFGLVQIQYQDFPVNLDVLPGDYSFFYSPPDLPGFPDGSGGLQCVTVN